MMQLGVRLSSSRSSRRIGVALDSQWSTKSFKLLEESFPSSSEEAASATIDCTFVLGLSKIGLIIDMLQ